VLDTGRKRRAGIGRLSAGKDAGQNDPGTARVLFVNLRLVPILAVILSLQAMPMRLLAHHATAAQYDISKTVTFTGVISKLEWSNPHVHASIDVKRDSGVERWDVELASPGGIIVAGLSRDLLKPGTTLTVTGYPGNRSDRTVCATQVKMPNGMTATFTVGI
jgi:hypothetical protein